MTGNLPRNSEGSSRFGWRNRGSASKARASAGDAEPWLGRAGFLLTSSIENSPKRSNCFFTFSNCLWEGKGRTFMAQTASIAKRGCKLPQEPMPNKKYLELECNRSY